MVSLQPRFPFPLEDDRYVYVNNLKPLEPPCCIQLTTEYFDEISEKRRLLSARPERCFHALPDTMAAQWEVVDTVVQQLVETYPDCFTLEKRGDEWTFRNLLLNEIEHFTFGDASTLPVQPLDWIGRHVQEDLIIMVQRDDDLFLEAGQLCFPSVWSLTFDLGMSFQEIHRPVPWNPELAERIRRFLLRVEAGKPWTRLNWTMHVGKRLDIPPETFDEWGPARYQLAPENVADEVQFRIEEQCVLRLPGCNALLFTIHTYMKSLGELVRQKEWAKKLHSVLVTLPDEVVAYKGLSTYRHLVIDYLGRCV
jgi:dimethylamine monooxygenase subunit A